MITACHARRRAPRGRRSSSRRWPRRAQHPAERSTIWTRFSSPASTSVARARAVARSPDISALKPWRYVQSGSFPGRPERARISAARSYRIADSRLAESSAAIARSRRMIVRAHQQPRGDVVELLFIERVRGVVEALRRVGVVCDELDGRGELSRPRSPRVRSPAKRRSRSTRAARSTCAASNLSNGRKVQNAPIASPVVRSARASGQRVDGRLHRPYRFVRRGDEVQGHIAQRRGRRRDAQSRDEGRASRVGARQRAASEESPSRTTGDADRAQRRVHTCFPQNGVPARVRACARRSLGATRASVSAHAAANPTRLIVRARGVRTFRVAPQGRNEHKGRRGECAWGCPRSDAPSPWTLRHINPFFPSRPSRPSGSRRTAAHFFPAAGAGSALPWAVPCTAAARAPRRHSRPGASGAMLPRRAR